MTEPSSSSNPSFNLQNEITVVPDIPIEIVSEEEMAFIESAMAIAASRYSLSSSSSSVTHHIRSISFASKKRFSICSQSVNDIKDIEDSADFNRTVKRIKGNDNNNINNNNVNLLSLFHRYRRKRGFSVTDFTAAEWCEKQTEFSFEIGKPKATNAMKAGSARHAKLEAEVVKKIKILVVSTEDRYALKFLNFIVGANQLLFDGLTRELPIIGFVRGTWMVGVIDEIRLCSNISDGRVLLIDTKTRQRNTLPLDAQRRNGRLQLMCYKYLWDTIVTTSIPSKQFFDYFALNPNLPLSEDIQEHTTNCGFPSKTLEDMIAYVSNTCSLLPMADDELMLRYEFQEDHSLIGEDKFSYNDSWLKTTVDSSLEFWMGKREANYTPAEERWKCRMCKFASLCPSYSNTTPNSDPS